MTYWSPNSKRSSEKVPLATPVPAAELELGGLAADQTVVSLAEPLVSDAPERRARRKAQEEEQGTHHGFCLFLSVLLYGLLAVVICAGVTGNVDEDTFTACLVIGCVAYLMYLCEALSANETMMTLCNWRESQHALDELVRLKRVPPVLTVAVQCYHYEDRTTHSTHTNADGTKESRTSHSRVRVNTHYKQSRFEFEHWRDVSEAPYAVVRPFEVVRLYIRAKVAHGDEATAGAYADKCRMLRDIHGQRDTHFQFSENATVAGVPPYMLLQPEDARLRRWWMRWQVYVLATVCLGAWPYRMLLESHTTKVNYELLKEVYVGR